MQGPDTGTVKEVCAILWWGLDLILPLEGENPEASAVEERREGLGVES